MIWLAIVSMIAAIVILARLSMLKREIRRMEKQLRQWNRKAAKKKVDLQYFDRHLESLASEINELMEEARQAKAEQKRTEQELKRAISSISHDIRTPMTSILGYVQYLQSEDLPPDKRSEYTNIVRKGALRLKRLLDDFFELSVMESPDYPLKQESIHMNELVLDVLVGFYEAFNQRRIEPQILIPHEAMSIRADPSAVKRVIENLVANALRHAAGDVRIELAQSNSIVRFTIRNPAPQLCDKDLVYLFDRFYKADLPRSGQGAGLGLSIAKSLMLKMNGTLTAELHDHWLVMTCEWKALGASR